MGTDTEPSDDAWALLTENGIDPGWLTEVLNRAGSPGVISTIEAGLVGTGQVGENVRCRLRWADGAQDPQETDRPQSVVIKLASSNETSRAAAKATNTYVREVGFYRDVAHSVAIRVPKAYHVSENQDDNRFILVMEDIAPAEAGDQLAGCTLAEAELGVLAAADLHGSTWGRSELGDLPWIEGSSPDRAAETGDLYRALYPAFVERYRARLDEQDLAVGAWIATKMEAWMTARRQPQCLIHGDFRLDNMLFGAGPTAPPLTTVDWQTPRLGPPLGDVAYFLSGSLAPVELRANETELLARYQERLGHHGVVLSTEEIWSEYRAAAPAGYVMAVIASQLVGQTDRGDDMFMVMAKGSAAQATDLQTAALFD